MTQISKWKILSIFWGGNDRAEESPESPHVSYASSSLVYPRGKISPPTLLSCVRWWFRWRVWSCCIHCSYLAFCSVLTTGLHILKITRGICLIRSNKIFPSAMKLIENCISYVSNVAGIKRGEESPLSTSKLRKVRSKCCLYHSVMTLLWLESPIDGWRKP